MKLFDIFHSVLDYFFYYYISRRSRVADIGCHFGWLRILLFGIHKFFFMVFALAPLLWPLSYLYWFFYGKISEFYIFAGFRHECLFFCRFKVSDFNSLPKLILWKHQSLTLKYHSQYWSIISLKFRFFLEEWEEREVNNLANKLCFWAELPIPSVWHWIHFQRCC